MISGGGRGGGGRLWTPSLSWTCVLVQSNVHFGLILFLFESSVSTKGPGFWMRDWPIPWHLESLVYRELFTSMSLHARSGLRYIHSFIYSGFSEADWASSDKSN